MSERVNVFFNLIVDDKIEREQLMSSLLQAVGKVGEVVVMKVTAVEESNSNSREGMH